MPIILPILYNHKVFVSNILQSYTHYYCPCFCRSYCRSLELPSESINVPYPASQGPLHNLDARELIVFAEIIKWADANGGCGAREFCSSAAGGAGYTEPAFKEGWYMIIAATLVACTVLQDYAGLTAEEEKAALGRGQKYLDKVAASWIGKLPQERLLGFYAGRLW